jgi:acetyltransferase-like isoleucine patch superfamily enzyme
MSEYFLPAEDVNDENATIVKLFFNSGDKVKKGEAIYSFETTKALIDVESESDGFINYFIQEGGEVNIGSLVCEISSVRKKLEKIIKNQEIQDQKNIKLTKKAILLAKTHEIDIESLDLEGIIKEKDLIPFIKDEHNNKVIDRCLKLSQTDKFIQFLLKDDTFQNFSSEEKIEKYRENGHEIGNNVSIAKGAVLIGNKIIIEDNVSIGSNSYIESPEIHIGKNTSIGSDCEFVASRILIGSYNYIAKRVYIDISGGRSADSNFISGRGCLIAYETYINVCHQVEIGENVALSPKSMIYTHSYWQSILDGYPAIFGPVKIEDNSWVGSMAQILPNIIVRTGSIIISNSLVTSDVMAFAMVGGVPATILKEELKKNKSKTKKNQIMNDLFTELGDWLNSHHYEVEKITNLNIVIADGNEKKSCLLLINNSFDNNHKFDIVICFDTSIKVPKYFKTLLNINDKSYLGPIDSVEKMIIEFFRRRGIRFYE